MLYGDWYPEEDSEDAMTDLSEDDLLFSLLDDDPLLWDSEDTTLLPSVTTMSELTQHHNSSDINTSQIGSRTDGETVVRRVMRDR